MQRSQFTDSPERKALKEKTGVKTKRGSVVNVPEHNLDVIMGSMGSSKVQSKSLLAAVNLQNNKAGRRVSLLFFLSFSFLIFTFTTDMTGFLF